jgi:hypothetical protein
MSKVMPSATSCRSRTSYGSQSEDLAVGMNRDPKYAAEKKCKEKNLLLPVGMWQCAASNETSPAYFWLSGTLSAWGKSADAAQTGAVVRDCLRTLPVLQPKTSTHPNSFTAPTD